jgi:hypothetical protein
MGNVKEEEEEKETTHSIPSLHFNAPFEMAIKIL